MGKSTKRPSLNNSMGNDKIRIARENNSGILIEDNHTMI